MTSPGRSISLSSRLTTAALAIAVMVGAASVVHCDSSLPRDVNYDSSVGAEFTPPQPKADGASDANVDGSPDASDAQTGGTGGSAGATGTGGSSGTGGLPATGGTPATGGEAVAGAGGSGGEGGAAGSQGAAAGAGGAGGVASGGAAGG